MPGPHFLPIAGKSHSTTARCFHAALGLLLAFSFVSAALAQQTIHVPADQPTIQAGMNAANNGDTVLVSPGTYYENINFNGKAITVTSSAGPAVTIINGGYKPGQATVTFANQEKSTSVISNFTITGGGDTIFGTENNGGVYVSGLNTTLSGASPTIQGNTITANYCHNVDIEFATSLVLKNEISGLLLSGQTTSYCTFPSGVHLQGTPNYLPAQGRGSTVQGNTIENNLNGSAINLWAAQKALIGNNVIRNNTSPDPGSAFISVNDSATVLVNNLIYGNTSTCGGALAFMEAGTDPANPTILIANNTIVDNVTPKPGGFSNCTAIAQLYPSPYSYGMNGPGAVVINNIISGSTPYPAVNCDWYHTPSESDQPTFANNILNNAGGPFFGSFCVDVSNQYNNITADPQFVSPSTGDYHLRITSPAIDSGQNSALQTFLTMTGSPLTSDLDGNPRIQDATNKGYPVVDMGAYEYPDVPATPFSTTLTSSLNPAPYGQSVTFSVTVTATSSGAPPTGNITFTDGTTVLSSQPLQSTGATTASAQFTTASLAAGSHTITAIYNPTTESSASSASLTEVVTGIIPPPDFTITLANPTITLQTQHHTTTIVTLTSLNAFADTLTLACANPPAYITCKFTPGPASLAANGTATVSFYVDTDSIPGYALNQPAPPPRNSPTLPLNFAFLMSPVGLLAGVIVFPKRSSGTRHLLRLLALTLAFLPLSLTLTGCTTIKFPYTAPPSAAPGTYTLPITATGTTTGISHTAQVTLTITP